MAIAASLRAQLLLWILVPLTGIFALNVWGAYSDAWATAQLVRDHALLASARGIAEQIRETDGVIEAVIPPSAIERFSASDGDRVVYRVMSPTGEMLAGYPDVPEPPSGRPGLGPAWYDGAFRGRPIRVVVIEQPVVGRQTEPALVRGTRPRPP